MDCETLVKHLSAYIDGELDEQLSEEARQHLATCQNCRVVLDSTRRTILLYREQARVQTISADRSRTLFDQIAEAFKARE